MGVSRLLISLSPPTFPLSRRYFYDKLRSVRVLPPCGPPAAMWQGPNSERDGWVRASGTKGSPVAWLSPRRSRRIVSTFCCHATLWGRPRREGLNPGGKDPLPYRTLRDADGPGEATRLPSVSLVGDLFGMDAHIPGNDAQGASQAPAPQIQLSGPASPLSRPWRSLARARREGPSRRPDP